MTPIKFTTCDRCHKPADEGVDLRGLSENGVISPSVAKLCPRCYGEFVLWLSEDPEEEAP